MKNTLTEMWRRFNLLSDFKYEMNRLGYSSGDLFVIESQISLLNELIEIESMNILNELLKTRTYHRLLKSIDRGIEYLPEIISDCENWVLNNVKDDSNAWIDKDVLVFSTRNSILAFSKSTRIEFGNTYLDGKWQ